MRILWALVLVLLPAMASAQNFPSPREAFVNDYADILDDAAEESIRKRLVDYRENTGQEFTVVTVKNIALYGGTSDVPDFATGLFNEWGVGDVETNNGLLMLVALDDREAFTATGDGIEDRYNNALDLIFDRYMRDQFRAENYAKGIEDGVDATIAQLSAPPPAPPTNYERFGSWLNERFWIILIGMFFVFITAGNWIMDQTYRVRRCPKCGRRNLRRQRKVLEAATRSAKGERAVEVTCANCDYHDHETYVIPRHTKSSSSSSSSFGGGSSSGGGGGKW